MRSSSNWRRSVAKALCAALLGQWAVPSLAPAGPPVPEPALLLKYSAPQIPEDAARDILDPQAGILTGALAVRFVPLPAEPSETLAGESDFRVPDDGALGSIAAKVASAALHMDRVEPDAAQAALSEAEREARQVRFTESVRPFLAEIYLREAILRLWEGDVAGAERLLTRSRALRPGFTPDPALFPPQVLAAWEAARTRPLPEAELLVQSLPSGARITLDGAYQGTTPSRVHPGTGGPVKIRVSHPGYRDVERTGQWLPGDAETVMFTLPGDRVARLGELFAAPDEAARSGAGPLLAEFARAAGVSRVAVVTLERSATGEGYRARLYSGGASGEAPAFLGAAELPAGPAGAQACGDWAAVKLVDNGWPPEPGDPEGKPWYKQWWFWGILIGGAGLAAALGGGGGGGGSAGGSSTGSVAVNF